MRIGKIVSGGQTGADRGGLDAAMELGVPHSGWCPKGRLAEDGVIPCRYVLQETESPDAAVRTEKNVLDSDGTLLVTFGRPTGGSALTAKLAVAHGKPLLHLDIEDVEPIDAVDRLRDWIEEKGISSLNVAGPRESMSPGVHDGVRALLLTALG